MARVRRLGAGPVARHGVRGCSGRVPEWAGGGTGAGTGRLRLRVWASCGSSWETRAECVCLGVCIPWLAVGGWWLAVMGRSSRLAGRLAVGGGWG